MSIKTFYSDRYYHIKSFAVHAVFAVLLCVLLYNWHDSSFYEFQFSPLRAVLYIVLGIYWGGLSAVFIHNATHNSFPNKFLNEICGQIAGIHQLWGFMGWKVIHLFHHQYSDRNDRDPHSPKGKTFGQFLKGMFFLSSRSISERYREHWGLNTKTKILHTGVLVLFHIMAVSYLLFWYLLLGTEGFLFFYIPSLAFNHWFFAYINYYCHPVDPVTGDTAAANLDETLHQKLVNFLWFGIYYHGNHHKRPQLFNPKYMVASAPRSATLSPQVAYARNSENHG